MSERKAILVTGSSHGIGAATVIAFAKDGYDVGINSTKRPRERKLSPRNAGAMVLTRRFINATSAAATSVNVC